MRRKYINITGHNLEEGFSKTKPSYYHKGKIDLIHSWYLLYPFNEFVAIMESHMHKYQYRDKEDKFEDMRKHDAFSRRLQQ